MAGGVSPTPSIFLYFFSVFGWKQSPWSLRSKSLHDPLDPISSGPACATPPQLPSCSAPQRPGQGAERVYAAQRGQSWEGPGQRPLPWGIGGRWKPSPAGCTDLHGKSRMTSQLRKLAWGGEGAASSGYVVTGLEVGSRGPQVGVRATYGEAWERR